MTLDRMVMFGVFAVYLATIGIPLEEKKAIEKWGDDYIAYCKAVPAIVPRFGSRTE